MKILQTTDLFQTSRWSQKFWKGRCSTSLKYLEANQLNEPLQSAYKPFHSWYSTIGKRHCVMLLLLHLSAAFDTKGRISYIPWCIASYYIIKLPNARDAISSTRTWQLNSSGKRLVLPIKLSVPLLCRSIYDFRFTIPNISLVKSKRVFWPPIMS